MIDMNFLPINNSWILGFIFSQFPNIGLKDYYLNNLLVIRDSDYSLVNVDDELFDNDEDFKKFLEKFDPQKDVLLCKSPVWSQILRDYKFSVIHIPYYVILDDCIAVKKMNKDTPLLLNDSVHFFCLNRNGNIPRFVTVKTLKKYNLIDFGYVTYNAINGQNTLQIPNVRTVNDLSHYVANKSGFERNNHTINGIDCSSNALNYFYISNNIPGTINISVETKITKFFPSEKSFIFAFTKRLPIIIAEPNRIKDIRDQGFDVFDDVIDHSYDEIYGLPKIEVAIEKNAKILSSATLSPFINRVENNYKYLLNDWLNTKLYELCVNIKKLF